MHSPPITGLVAMSAVALLLAACAHSPVDVTVVATADQGLETPAPVGFSWILDGRLAGLSDPRTGGMDEEQDFAWVLNYLHKHGVRMLVTLTADPLDGEIVEGAGIHPVHIPVHDFKAPKVSQLEKFAKLADRYLDAGDAVAVHCTAGMGRTGTFLAAYLVAHGTPAKEAIDEVRRLRPGSIETEEQEAVIYALEKLGN
jgi:atypical dual specificity phosphatase